MNFLKRLFGAKPVPAHEVNIEGDLQVGNPPERSQEKHLAASSLFLASAVAATGRRVTLEQLYEQMSQELIAKHGPLIKVDCVSHYPKFEIYFDYKDGTRIYSGPRTGQHDIHFLSFGYVGEGPRYAQRFLAAAGFDLSSQQIENIRPGDSLQLEGGKLKISHQIDRLMEESGVNACDEKGRTGLWYAIKDGDVERVKALIAAGADVNVKDKGHKTGDTALMWAAMSWRLRAGCGEALIAAGAEVNATNNNGETALMRAVDDKDDGCTRALIAAGADIHAKDDSGNSVLMWAAQKGDVDCIKTLIAKGADVNAKNNSGDTALISSLIGLRVKREAIKALIASGADVNAKNNNDKTALMAASGDGDVQNILTLIELGAEVNAQDNKGETSLMKAVRGYDGHISARAKALIAAGADVNMKNHSGKTALTGEHHSTLTELLKAAGAREQ